MPFPKVTKRDVIEKLEKVDIRKGDVIYVPSFTPILGNTENIIDDTIDALIEVVGADGTVVMPTFNWDYCKGEVFDPETSPSQVGVLTEMFRKRIGVLRSITPPWCTFAATGKMAKEIVGIKGTSSFGSDSILEFIYEINAKYVLLGCSYNEGAVHIHWLEERFEVPYRYWKQFKGQVKTKGELVKNISYMYARRLDTDVTIDSNHLTTAFEKTGKVKVEKLGLGELKSFRTKDYVEFMIPYFKKDTLVVLRSEGRRNSE